MKGNKLFIYFLGGSFIVAALLVFLYRAIKTDLHIYSFMFLSMLIVLFFCAFLLELMFLEPITDEIIDVAQESRFLYNILFTALFLTILVVLPLGIIREGKNFLEYENKIKPTNCSLVFNTLQRSPTSIYDTRLLGKCQYTRPLIRIIPTNNSEIEKSANNLLFVIDEYMELFAQNISFALTVLLGMFSGVSYAAFVTLFFKKLVLLIMSMFSHGALKILFSPDEKSR